MRFSSSSVVLHPHGLTTRGGEGSLPDFVVIWFARYTGIIRGGQLISMSLPASHTYLTMNEGYQVGGLDGEPHGCLEDCFVDCGGWELANVEDWVTSR